MSVISGSYCISFPDIQAAYRVISPHVHKTPLLRCSAISQKTSANVLLKTENLQRTGSFKFRGAMNAIKNLISDGEKDKVVVTHSSGNHGQAVALAASLCGQKAFIVMPENAPVCKREAVKGYGGNIIQCLSTEKSREETCKQTVIEKEGIFIHASQNPLIIAGQGTMAIEMLEQNPEIDAIVASVGGGGLISGIAIAAKSIKPTIKIYGAEPEEAKSCFSSKKLNQRTKNPKTPVTVADGVKVSIGENTWPIIKDLVDDVITVSEEEIKKATKFVFERARLVVEPSSGVSVAAVMKESFKDLEGFDQVKNIAVVLCGGNCDLDQVMSW